MAVGLFVATILQVSAQPNAPVGSVEVDLNEATTQFRKMFEQTCYRQRHSLRSLITDRPLPEFEMVPRQYPARDEAQGTTLLAEWGLWTRSGPYLVGVQNSDIHPDVTSCVLRAIAVRKEALKDAMLDIEELSFFESKEENETTIVGFMHKQERNLRVLCATPKIENIYIGDCYLWSWPEPGS